MYPRLASTTDRLLSERSVRRAHAMARRLLGCDHLAADVVQDASIALWQQAVPPVEPEGWLVLAVRNRARHLRRTLRRRHHHEEHAAAARCAIHPDCDNPLHHAHAHELAARLAQAVATLPAEQQTLFVLHERTGLDYRGIARELALPIGTVRSRLHRARLALRATLPEAT